MATTQKIPATLIPGDGIGPEVSAATLEVLDALGAPFQWETHVAGVAGPHGRLRARAVHAMAAVRGGCSLARCRHVRPGMPLLL